MARRDIERQTLAIICCLFDDDTEVASFRCHKDSDIETDGIGGEDDDFDPVPLAEKLREVADQMMTDPRFQDVRREMLSATADHSSQVVREMFCRNVETLCRAQPAEVSPEIQMTRAAVALALYLKDKLPQLKTKVQNTLNAFLNQNVDGDSFARQGGWDAVANPRRPQ